MNLSKLLKTPIKDLFKAPPPSHGGGVDIAQYKPWDGRREQVYQIIALCWRSNRRSYSQIRLEVKRRTGKSCSNKTIADWKAHYLKASAGKRW